MSLRIEDTMEYVEQQRPSVPKPATLDPSRSNNPRGVS